MAHQNSRIGFLGLGRMGTAIALRMAEAGYGISAWNRSQPEALASLRAVGVDPVESAAESLAERVSFSMLADDAAAESVLSPENIGEAGAPRIHVNMASVSVQTADLLSRRFADANVAYIAAPVLGRPDSAAAGRLNVLLAGPASSCEEVDPILATTSQRRWLIGETPRQANAVKIAMNLMLINALVSMGEGIALVEAEGVDAGEFAELFTGTFFGGAIHSVYGKMIAERGYSPPGFTVALGMKDLSLAERLAADTGVDLATAEMLRGRFDAALQDPQLASLDWSAIAEVGRRPGPTTV